MQESIRDFFGGGGGAWTSHATTKQKTKDNHKYCVYAFKVLSPMLSEISFFLFSFPFFFLFFFLLFFFHNFFVSFPPISTFHLAKAIFNSVCVGQSVSNSVSPLYKITIER